MLTLLLTLVTFKVNHCHLYFHLFSSISDCVTCRVPQASVTSMLPLLPYNTELDAHTLMMIGLVFLCGIESVLVFLATRSHLAAYVHPPTWDNCCTALSLFVYAVVNFRFFLRSWNWPPPAPATIQHTASSRSYKTRVD
jgi:hypothetical protein